MDTEELKKEIEDLRMRIEQLESFVASLKNPSQLDPGVLSALKSLGL